MVTRIRITDQQFQTNSKWTSSHVALFWSRIQSTSCSMFHSPSQFFSSLKCFDKHIGNNLEFRFNSRILWDANWSNQGSNHKPSNQQTTHYTSTTATQKYTSKLVLESVKQATPSSSLLQENMQTLPSFPRTLELYLTKYQQRWIDRFIQTF